MTTNDTWKRAHAGHPAGSRRQGHRASRGPLRHRYRRPVVGPHRSPPSRPLARRGRRRPAPGGEFRARFFASGWEGTGRVEVCEPPRRLQMLTSSPDEPDGVSRRRSPPTATRPSWSSRTAACPWTRSPPTGRETRSTSRTSPPTSPAGTCGCAGAVAGAPARIPTAGRRHHLMALGC